MSVTTSHAAVSDACSPQPTAVRLAACLVRSEQTLALAESCTGGLLSAALTAIPGASGWFRGAVVAYDNAVKRDLLDVHEAILAGHGAVSDETARAMARGVRRRCRASLGLSLTGIAGPGGSTPEKPVGLVYIGLSDAHGEAAFRLIFEGDRDAIRDSACRKALDVLLTRIERFHDP